MDFGTIIVGYLKRVRNKRQEGGMKLKGRFESERDKDESDKGFES